MLDVGQFIDGAVYIDEGLEVSIEVLTDGRLETGRSGTSFAEGYVLAVHHIHVRRRSTEVGDDTVPVRQLAEPLYLAEDGSLGAGDDLLALMGGDGTESTTAETPAMHAHRPFNHVVGRDALVLVLGMRRVGERQVVDGIELLSCHGRVRGVDHDVAVANRLDERRLMNLIGLYLHEAEVLRMLALVP